MSRRALGSNRSFRRLVARLSRLKGGEYRPYQADAAWVSLRALRKSSIVVNLPQGTGKTFVSQLVAYEYLYKRPHSKILVVVPTKELREQYCLMADWMGMSSPRIVVLDFSDGVAADSRVTRLMVRDAHIVVTTPQLFVHRVSQLDSEAFNAIELCILDEVDLWSIEDFESVDGVRFHESFRVLGPKLAGQGTRFLGLTASALTDRGRQLLVKELDCKELQLPLHRSIVRRLPHVRIEPVPCIDDFVVVKDSQITEISRRLWRRLSKETDLDELLSRGSDVWSAVKAIANGSEGPEAAQIASALLSNEGERNRLFESAVPPVGDVKIRGARRLAEARRPAVIYCREARLVERFAKADWQTSIAKAYSEMGDRYLSQIRRFKDQRCEVLIMTRDLGKRGVDFPEAQTLVLCSPKSSWRVMDQELCRTRGQVRRRKTVHILFYRYTYEEEKLRRVLAQLLAQRMYGRFQKFDVAIAWNKWLRARRPLSLVEYLTSEPQPATVGGRFRARRRIAG